MPRVGLGGGGALKAPDVQEEAVALIQEAFDNGIRFFDTLKKESSSEHYLGAFLKGLGGAREEVFISGRSACRTYDGAMSDLEGTFQVLGIRHLDLWLMHDVRTMAEIRALGRPGGALEAFIDAREAGVVRYVGIAGHYDPGVLTYAVDNWPIDTVVIPVNPVETVLGGFLDMTVDAALRRGIEIIGTKTLGGGHFIFPGAGIGPGVLFRFALSHPVAMILAGCSSRAEVQALASAAKDPDPMTVGQQEALVEKFRPQAEKLAYYRGNL
jgi:aryl-alcohol dehydrogenase-like predicted oxidoreductase